MMQSTTSRPGDHGCHARRRVRGAQITSKAISDGRARLSTLKFAISSQTPEDSFLHRHQYCSAFIQRTPTARASLAHAASGPDPAVLKGAHRIASPVSRSGSTTGRGLRSAPTLPSAFRKGSRSRSTTELNLTTKSSSMAKTWKPTCQARSRRSFTAAEPRQASKQQPKPHMPLSSKLTGSALRQPRCWCSTWQPTIRLSWKQTGCLATVPPGAGVTLDEK